MWLLQFIPCLYIHILSNQPPLLSLLWSTLHQVCHLLRSELQCAMVKRFLHSNQKLFLINTKSALSTVNHVEHQTQTMSRYVIECRELGEITNGGIAYSRVFTGLLGPFAHCTLRVIKAVDMNSNSDGM